MSNRKAIWDTLDALEGRKDSSYENLQREKVRQGTHIHKFMPQMGDLDENGEPIEMCVVGDCDAILVS